MGTLSEHHLVVSLGCGKLRRLTIPFTGHNMQYPSPLQAATLLRRYKRFLADIRLPSGEEVTIHCPNTGSMRNCLAEGGTIWYSTSDNPKRKYSRTWEIATTPDGDLAGIKSAYANELVVEAIGSGLISQLQGYSSLRTEVRYGEERSRIDILLQGDDKPDCYIEVKSVTLREDLEGAARRGLFPDSVSDRASKHLRELMLMREQGRRAVLLFCVQHTGIDTVSPADELDPRYGQLLRQAAAAGVEIYSYGADISAEAITLVRPLSVVL